MTPKQTPKDKPGPFASYIRPSETILWQSREQITTRDVIPIRFIVAIIVLITVIIVIAILYQRTNPQMSTNELIIGTMAILLLLGLRIAMRGGSTQRSIVNSFMPSTRTLSEYAVTNQRLLFQRGNNIRSLSLTNVPSIKIQSTSDTHGTLMFGVTFPMWEGVADPDEVRAIIEKAQRNRTQKR
jgi:hypothetical protein